MDTPTFEKKQTNKGNAINQPQSHKFYIPPTRSVVMNLSNFDFVLGFVFTLLGVNEFCKTVVLL